MTALISLIIILFAITLIVLLEGLLFVWVGHVDVDDNGKMKSYFESDPARFLH